MQYWNFSMELELFSKTFSILLSISIEYVHEKQTPTSYNKTVLFRPTFDGKYEYYARPSVKQKVR